MRLSFPSNPVEGNTFNPSANKAYTFTNGAWRNTKNVTTTSALINSELPAVVTDGNASRTLSSADAGSLIRMTSASANSVVVPLEATAHFPVKGVVTIRQVGTGTTTIVAEGGVTLTSPALLALRAQNSTVQLIKVATNTWDLIGDVATA